MVIFVAACCCRSSDLVVVRPVGVGDPRWKAGGYVKALLGLGWAWPMFSMDRHFGFGLNFYILAFWTFEDV